MRDTAVDGIGLLVADADALLLKEFIQLLETLVGLPLCCGSEECQQYGKYILFHDFVDSVFMGCSLTLRFLDVAVLRENGCLVHVTQPRGTGLPSMA